MRTITKICTGCGACAMRCPAQAINMTENKFGEYTPHVTARLCINCNLCVNICPQNNSPSLNYPLQCFVAWSRNPEDLKYSASGGVAAVFLEEALNNRYIAYSCDYNEKLELFHFAIESKTDIRKAQSSKYSQSNSFIVFNKIEKFLKNDQIVLFIGTPCQIAGLRNYLCYEYAKLITIDLVCHGTPPTKYVREHLKSLHIHKYATKVRFRGEYDQFFTVFNKDKIIYQKYRADDSYFSAFYANEINRESCYSCKYANPERCGDITIGDFWGLGDLRYIEKQSERPSLILINTEKGRAFLKLVTPNLWLEERPCKEGIAGNGRLNYPPGKNRLSKSFRSIYPLVGFEKAIIGSNYIVNFFRMIKR